MSSDANYVSLLVRRELDRITDIKVRTAVQSLLVARYSVDRDWDYGPPGQTFPCWTVLEHPPSSTAIAYCEQGFGPSCPWGLVWLSGDYMGIGMDSGWFVSLQDAFRQSHACDCPAPDGYEVA